jgi:hypothetical protein
VLEDVLSESESVRHLSPPVVPVAAPSRSTAVAPYASRALLAVQVRQITLTAGIRIEV